MREKHKKPLTRDGALHAPKASLLGGKKTIPLTDRTRGTSMGRCGRDSNLALYTPSDTCRELAEDTSPGTALSMSGFGRCMSATGRGHADDGS